MWPIGVPLGSCVCGSPRSMDQCPGCKEAMPPTSTIRRKQILNQAEVVPRLGGNIVPNPRDAIRDGQRDAVSGLSEEEELKRQEMKDWLAKDRIAYEGGGN